MLYVLLSNGELDMLPRTMNTYNYVDETMNTYNYVDEMCTMNTTIM